MVVALPRIRVKSRDVHFMATNGEPRCDIRQHPLGTTTWVSHRLNNKKQTHLLSSVLMDT